MLFDVDRIGAGLVVAREQHAITEAAKSGAAVITAPPGTGKTTVVPPLISNLVAARGGGKTIVTQPRRIAARSAARRIAHLAQEKLGGAVGYAVRGKNVSGPNTRLEIVTTGILLRRLLSNPGLEGVGAVILDEVHERSLEGDLLLALIADVKVLRPDLVIIAMSATLQAEVFADNLGGAPVVDVPAALYPVEVQYAPYGKQRLMERGVDRGFLAHVARVAAASQQTEGSDALVFLPGAWEVDQVADLIRGQVAPDIAVLPLHGRLPAADQDRAIAGRNDGEAGRIVVSTAVAESSLTVQGAHLVIDAGLSREVRRDSGRDMTGLVTVSASRASAQQRAGRAGRLGPGRVVRAYSQSEFAQMPAHSQPEISSADLTDTALLFAAWGTPGGAGLQLPTPPPAAALERAETALRHMGAVDETGLITELGRQMIALPVGARAARALLLGAKYVGELRPVAQVIAAVSDDHRIASAAADDLVRDLQSGRHSGASRWRAEVRRLENAVQRVKADTNLDDVSTRHDDENPRNSASRVGAGGHAGVVIGLARPEWIARRTGENSRTFLLAAGTRAAVPPGSPLAQSEWIAVHDVQRTSGQIGADTGAVIRLAGTLDSATAAQIAAPLASTRRDVVIENGHVRVREESRLGAIVLSQTAVAATPSEMAQAIGDHVRSRGLAVLNWGKDATELRGRLGLLARELGEPWPNMSEQDLLAGLEHWLLPEAQQLAPGSSIERINVRDALRNLLPWPQASRMVELVPTHLEVPSGSRIRIEYPIEGQGRATVSVKLQEVFGLAHTPRIVDGRVPVLFHLLSPARRPLAVTDDLASFWNGPYEQVRKEMRGRYPKHPWPEDPWSAAATARVKRR